MTVAQRTEPRRGPHRTDSQAPTGRTAERKRLLCR